MMMTSILEVEHVQKTYKGSTLGIKDVSFTIPNGSIVGFIGENGAGKSTTMGTIIGTLRKDGGTIRIFGEEMDLNQVAFKEEIGVVFDTMQLPGDLTVDKLGNVFQQLYKRWDQQAFSDYIDFFSLPQHKKIKGFSRGMSMKLSVSVALSHHARLLILDEATAGLDPGGRDDVLAALREFVQDQKRGILLSSHITSDIEKIADSLVFIKGGEVLLEVEKFALLDHYGIVQCAPDQYEQLEKSIVVAYRKTGEGFDVLVSNKRSIPSSMKPKHVSIDDITLLLMRGEKG
ncbi:ABC transporter ATP-binding protein [Alkalihalophilus lindianensis]|uniref:ABC transporter ATP-binding protein n=1 Tax=Alkalihalophilus lindianensis TaxID=1630542 RepID=A0ABU3X4H0_9BACI|nr:ABC transporter ATP-binding protein [Alkalihalophilus lindianensis]MDV2682776.1 ABC transporter ATP-binding protein [Alkalihalophilus lindianensis]